MPIGWKVMPTLPLLRRGRRLSRPDAHRWFTVMVVLSHRTFRWSVSWKTVLWTAGIAFGIWSLAVTGSAYGFWATKRIMNFGRLQRETQKETAELRAALEQAQKLESEIEILRNQHETLLKLLDPRNPKPNLPNAPGKEALSLENLGRMRKGLDLGLLQAKEIRARMEPVIWRWSHTPSILPTAGYVSSGFGVRINPFAKANTEDEALLGHHSGLDISNDPGTPIQATADGEVVSAGWADAYGYAVILRHQTHLETLYAHLEHWDVQVGQLVARGDVIGRMGRSGRATGVHLHYEVRQNGHPVNPTPYLRLQKAWLQKLK